MSVTSLTKTDCHQTVVWTVPPCGHRWHDISFSYIISNNIESEIQYVLISLETFWDFFLPISDLCLVVFMTDTHHKTGRSDL